MNRKKACHVVDRNLVDLAENHLDKETRQEIQEHLEHCDRCARLSRDFIGAWQNLSSPEELNLSPATLANLMKKVAASDEHPFLSPEVLISVRRFFRPAIASVLLLAGLLAGYELGKISPNDARPEDPFVARLLGSFEDIPRGSVADFYVGRQTLEKEKKNEK